MPEGRQGTVLATAFVMLRLEGLARASPRLPQSRWSDAANVTASVVIHVAVIAALVTFAKAGRRAAASHSIAPPLTATELLDTRRMIFIARPAPEGRGGGGGGNKLPGPIRRAEGVGSDAVTLRIAAPSHFLSETVVDVPLVPGVVLDARSLASGTFNQIGLPAGGDPDGLSTGSGSGGGVGTGAGIGIGPGTGPGVGAGSGGGTGGGVYRPGGAVSAPRPILQVKPTYTDAALAAKIQGTVVLELVVTRDGRPEQIRVVRSLDADGLDLQAVTAAGRWRFEPGRLNGAPVDVLVTLFLDFRIY